MRRFAAIAAALLALAAPAVAFASGHPLHKRTWLSGVVLTEYYPTAEKSCCNGALVAVPGIPGGRMRVDFLYGGSGLSMEGEAYGADGRMYHIESLGRGGWVNSHGVATHPTSHGTWTKGAPVWRAGGYWLSASHTVTYPLAGGGWAHGVGIRRVPPPGGISFAPGPSRPLAFWKSVAVDPRLIPLGSRVFIPAYVGVHGSNGWFVAQDTGGAIIGRHIDIYRTPPDGQDAGARSSGGARVLVVPPGA